MSIIFYILLIYFIVSVLGFMIGLWFSMGLLYSQYRPNSKFFNPALEGKKPSLNEKIECFLDAVFIGILGPIFFVKELFKELFKK
jgi:hypothetical protein